MKKRTARTPKTDPIIIAVLLFDKAVIVVVAFVAVIVVVVVAVEVVVVVAVDALLQKLVMGAFSSIWQIEYCTELQRVQVAL